MHGNDGVGVTSRGRRRRVWPANALLALGAWNSIVAGLLTLTLAGSVLVAGRGRKGCSASAGREHRQQPEAPDGRR